MTPLIWHWYAGVILIAVGLVAHAVLPRYEWQLTGDPAGIQQLLRIDHWTGEAAVITPGSRDWTPVILDE